MDGGEEPLASREERLVSVHGGDDGGVGDEGAELGGAEVVSGEDDVKVAAFLEPGREDLVVRGRHGFPLRCAVGETRGRSKFSGKWWRARSVRTGSVVCGRECVGLWEGGCCGRG